MPLQDPEYTAKPRKTDRARRRNDGNLQAGTGSLPNLSSREKEGGPMVSNLLAADSPRGGGAWLFQGLLEFTKLQGKSYISNQRLVSCYPVLLFLWCIKCELTAVAEFIIVFAFVYFLN
jgi:hypothetical protein